MADDIAKPLAMKAARQSRLLREALVELLRTKTYDRRARTLEREVDLALVRLVMACGQLSRAASGQKLVDLLNESIFHQGE